MTPSLSTNPRCHGCRRTAVRCQFSPGRLEARLVVGDAVPERRLHERAEELAARVHLLLHLRKSFALHGVHDPVRHPERVLVTAEVDRKPRLLGDRIEPHQQRRDVGLVLRRRHERVGESGRDDAVLVDRDLDVFEPLAPEERTVFAPEFRAFHSLGIDRALVGRLRLPRLSLRKRFVAVDIPLQLGNSRPGRLGVAVALVDDPSIIASRSAFGRFPSSQ